MKKLLVPLFGLVLLLAACTNGNKPTENGTDSPGKTAAVGNNEEAKEERNKQTAMQSIQAVISGNPDEALKNVTENAVDYYDGSMAPIEGLAKIKESMKMWIDNMEGYKGENLEAVADGNKVYVYGDWSGTFKNDFMGMKVAGKKFKAKDVDIFTFNDEGKITEHRSVQSMAGMMSSMK